MDSVNIKFDLSPRQWNAVDLALDLASVTLDGVKAISDSDTRASITARVATMNEVRDIIRRGGNL